jgi:hypothetical protein
MPSVKKYESQRDMAGPDLTRASMTAGAYQVAHSRILGGKERPGTVILFFMDFFCAHHTESRLAVSF